MTGDDPFDDPRWQQAEAMATARSKPNQRFIGCPLWWFEQVFPIVHGKNELAVALAAYRLRVIRQNRVVVVSNVYLARLGIDRHAKYRGLRRLADAGLIVIRRDNKRALEIEFRSKRRPRGDRQCAYCGKSVQAQRSTMRFCSVRCRAAAHRCNAKL
jgi:hypothetical protein